MIITGKCRLKSLSCLRCCIHLHCYGLYIVAFADPRVMIDTWFAGIHDRTVLLGSSEYKYVSLYGRFVCQMWRWYWSMCCSDFYSKTATSVCACASILSATNVTKKYFGFCPEHILTFSPSSQKFPQANLSPHERYLSHHVPLTMFQIHSNSYPPCPHETINHFCLNPA